MSVAVKRAHPSGEVGISVAGFSDTQQVIVGLGNLRDMDYFSLSVDEAYDVVDAIEDAVLDIRFPKNRK